VEKIASNILYISYDGMTDSLGQSQVIPYLKGLSEFGYIIYLISFEKKEAFAKNKDLISKILKEKNIVWYPLKYTAKPPVISTLWDVFKMKKQARILQKNIHFDIVHCRSYIAALAGLWLKEKYGVKFLFDMRGFWVDERVDGGIWALKNPIFRLIFHYYKKKEIQFFINADHTISLTEKAKIELGRWLNLKSIPISVIPCCSDLNHFNFSLINHELMIQKRKETGINSTDFVVSYLGSLGTWYLTEEMMLFFKRLKLIYKNAKFLLITPDKEDIINDLANKNNINKNDLIIRKASRNDVPIYLSLSNISIFFIKQAYSKIASSPTKMGEILGMGIPVITNSGIGDVDEIIESSKCGILIKNFNDKDYDYAINKIDKLIKSDKNIFVKASLKYFSLENGVKRYNEVYKKLLKIS